MPTIAAVGSACTLAAGGASALELGDIRVESNLGQPLRASIAYALNPNEQVQNHCIFLKSGTSADGLPLLSRARIQVTNGNIVLRGGTAIREPMFSMQLSVACPTAAKLIRNYTLMFNPAMPGDNEQVAPIIPAEQSAAQAVRLAPPQPTAVPANEPGFSRATPEPQVRAPRAASPAPSIARTSQPAVSQTAPRSRTAVTDVVPAANPAAVPTRDRYQVQPGDTLSEIVSRIENRPSGLWRAVGYVFAANPHAFIDGDMNLIKAGSWLEIPDLYAAAGIDAEAAPGTPAVARTPQPVAVPVIEELAPTETVSIDSGFTAQSQVRPAVADVPATPVVTEPAAIQPASNALSRAIPQIAAPTDSIQPGEVVVGRDIPVSPAGTTGIRANTAPAQISTVTGSKSGGLSWLAWLGGTGVALILGLLLFGRRVRSRFGAAPSPMFADAVNRSSDADEDSQRHTSAGHSASIVAGVITDSKLALDADLGNGSGLRSAAEPGAATDFDYDVSESGSSKVTEQKTEEAPDTGSTDIVPLLRVDESMIVEREVPPEREVESELEETASDLDAIEMQSSIDATDQIEELDFTEEIDLETLEQDYEHELTQSQMIDADMASKALELGEFQERDAEPGTVETATLQLGDDLTDLTAALPNPPGFEADLTEQTSILTTKEYADGDLTDLTAVLQSADPADENETALLSTNLPADAIALRSDNGGDLDATAMMDEPTANMPIVDDDAIRDLDETVQVGTTKHNKRTG